MVFKCVDSGSIVVEQLFSHCKRTMTSDRNRIGNLVFEAIHICHFNPDLMNLSKKGMLEHIYEMIILPE